jgi:hypothetical protein
MIIVPGRTYEPVVTRHSRELSRRVEQVVREYQSQNDDVSDEELRSALQLATRATAGEDTLLRRKRIIVGAVAAAVAMTGAMVAAGSRTREPDDMIWLAVAGMAAVIGVAFAVIRTVRRS